jgi:hypothetical protein
MNGSRAAFLLPDVPNRAFGRATVTLSPAADGWWILGIDLRAGLSVRAVADMPNMSSMGSAALTFRRQRSGRYAVTLSFPMTGVERIRIQVMARGQWQDVRVLLYDVDSAGRASLISPGLGS